MVKLKELRKKSIETLKGCQNDSPLADVDYILSHLGFSKTDLLLGEKGVDPSTEDTFYRYLERLKSGEPVQYITGKCEFMSLDFEVDTHTLIPRSDTEILVEAVIETAKNIPKPNILEVGCGSGCIAISLAHYIPDARVTSIDISDGALAVARRNAVANSVAERIEFIKHNVFDGFDFCKTAPDIIVSNPPYIPKADVLTLDKKVKDFEPLTALDGGDDGLDFYKFIAKNCILSSKGILAFEVGINQAQDVAKIMSERFCDIKIIPDLTGIERVVVGTLFQ